MVEQVSLPTDVPDEYLATLPFLETQEVFGAGAVLAGSARLAACGWHGTRFDPALGAFALVKRDGALADLVGERLKVTATGASVYVYVRAEKDILEDISLTRRAFMVLGPPATERLDAVVEVMA
jgi:hypothetical protein